MKAKLLATIIAVSFLYSMVSAQTYSIRVEFNTNLRADHSLESDVVESAPAGSILQVVDSSNRWLKINRNGREVWMASWVSHTRITESGPTASQPASNAPAQVDNCCFVDRQCHNAQDWENGYWAFQNGQCAAPTQPQPQTPVQPVSHVPAQIDNCCFVDRQCNTAADWENGFYAFQNGQCAAPAQTQPQTPAQPVSNVPAQVDNCCFVDRQCNTAADWENGFYAFRDNQCAAPAQSQPQTYTQAVSNVSGQVDNCCLVNRQCHSEGDWEQGFYAYLAGECPVSGGARRVAWTPHMPAGVTRFLTNPSSDPFNNCCYMHHNTCHSNSDWERGSRDYRDHVCLHPAPIPTRPPVEGPPHFIYWMDKAFELIERDAPLWLEYIYLSGMRKIVMTPTPGGSGFANQQWTFEFGHEAGENPDGLPSYDQYYGMTGVLVHEACHAIQQRTYTQTATVYNELTCLEAQVAVLIAIDPGHRWVDAIQWHIDNIHDPSTWWW